MQQINLEYLKKLNSTVSYKISSALKLYEGTSSYIAEIDNNYDAIITALNGHEDKRLINNFILLLSKLREHNQALERASYLNSVVDVSGIEINEFKEMQKKIKSRRRELFSILVKAKASLNSVT